MAKPISVEIYTESHRMLGRIDAGTHGLFGFLNVPTRSSIEVEGAHLTRLHQPARMVARYNRLWLMKHEIVAILLSARAELGPMTMVRAGYSTVVAHWVHIMLGGYELRGAVETSGRFDFDALMVEGERIFVPIYNAELTAILFPNIRADSLAALFNREMVDAMSLLPKEEIPHQNGTP